jgi:hypothetical protein
MQAGVPTPPMYMPGACDRLEPFEDGDVFGGIGRHWSGIRYQVSTIRPEVQGTGSV